MPADREVRRMADEAQETDGTLESPTPPTDATDATEATYDNRANHEADGRTQPGIDLPSGDDAHAAHPLASRLIGLGLHVPVRCIDTGIEGRGCGNTFLYPTDVLDDPSTDTRCPHCGGWLSRIDETDLPDGIDLPDQAIPFEMDEQEAMGAFSEWLSRHPYMPAAMRGIDWVATPVYAAQSWRSWDCQARIAGVAKAPKASGQAGPATTWRGVVATGTGRAPMVAAQGVSGIPDETMRDLRPFKVVGRILPVRANTIPVMPADAIIELPRKDADACRESSEGRAREAFVSELTEAAGTSELRAEESRLTEKIDKGGMLSVPIWLIRQRHGDIAFLMNGQDGHVVGHIPIDPGERNRFVTYAECAGGMLSIAVASAAWLAMTGGAQMAGVTSSPADMLTLACLVLLVTLAASVGAVHATDRRRMAKSQEADGANRGPSDCGRVRDLTVTRREFCGDESCNPDFAADDALEAFGREGEL